MATDLSQIVLTCLKRAAGQYLTAAEISAQLGLPSGKSLSPVLFNWKKRGFVLKKVEDGKTSWSYSQVSAKEYNNNIAGYVIVPVDIVVRTDIPLVRKELESLTGVRAIKIHTPRRPKPGEIDVKLVEQITFVG